MASLVASGARGRQSTRPLRLQWPGLASAGLPLEESSSARPCEQAAGKAIVELLLSRMVAYSWGKMWSNSNQIQPKYAAFFNSDSARADGSTRSARVGVAGSIQPKPRRPGIRSAFCLLLVLKQANSEWFRAKFLAALAGARSAAGRRGGWKWCRVVGSAWGGELSVVRRCGGPEHPDSGFWET